MVIISSRLTFQILLHITSLNLLSRRIQWLRLVLRRIDLATVQLNSVRSWLSEIVPLVKVLLVTY